MKVFSADETAQYLAYPDLIQALEKMFRGQCIVPLRHHHSLEMPTGRDATLLLMPAWSPTEDFGGIKLVNVNPDNSLENIPAVNASYLLFEKQTGQHICVINGAELTARRTAAASALAARYLARSDSRTLLIVGSGKVARQIADAYKAVLPIDKILVWSRRMEKRLEFATDLAKAGWDVEVPESLEIGVSQADIISCATLANEPILMGKWLRSGQHVDLIGSFTPKMREVDTDAIRKGRIFIDTEAALRETGDLRVPLSEGTLQEQDILATLTDLCTKSQIWRSSEDITLFKGVGTALEDLAAGILVYQSWQKTCS